MTSIIFMGTPKFAANILMGLIQEGYDIKAVVTQPDRLVGRKRAVHITEVKNIAIRYHIPVFQPEKLSNSKELKQIMEISPDLIVTAAYGQFLPSKLIKAAKIAAINVHGSLLPKYRGGAPIQYAIMNGDQETGVTIIYMTNQMDAGDMLAQERMPIEKDDDSGTIFEKMSILGKNLLLKTIPHLVNNQVKPIKQDEKAVVFSPTIKPSEERLSLKMTADQINNKIRALSPKPGAYFKDFNGIRTKLWKITPMTEKTNLKPGFVVFIDKNDLKISAFKNTVYKVQKIQPAGKSVMDIKAYLNGMGKNLKVGQQVVTDED